jgi:hypothetical protein
MGGRLGTGDTVDASKSVLVLVARDLLVLLDFDVVLLTVDFFFGALATADLDFDFLASGCSSGRSVEDCHRQISSAS